MTQVHSTREHSKSGGITPRILNFGNTWKWVVNITFW